MSTKICQFVSGLEIIYVLKKKFKFFPCTLQDRLNTCTKFQLDVSLPSNKKIPELPKLFNISANRLKLISLA